MIPQHFQQSFEQIIPVDETELCHHDCDQTTVYYTLATLGFSIYHETQDNNAEYCFNLL